MNKKSFLSLTSLLLLLPLFVFAQNFAPSELDSVTTDTPIITPLPGVNDDNPLIPKNITSPNTNQNSPTDSTSFTPVSQNENPSAGSINTSILNQKTPRQPNITKSGSLIDQIVPAGLFTKDSEKNQPLNKLLNQLFYIGLVAAVILAIVMIVRGGVEYMTIDAIASKENGKNRVKAALGGLLLAFSAILILNTINPGLTSLRIKFPQLQGIDSVEVEADITQSLAKSSPLTNSQLAEILSSGKIPTNISPAAQKIIAQALAELNKMNTGTIDNTQGGYLACAAAVNKVIELATGKPGGGGTSTLGLQKALATNPNFVRVPGGIQDSLPGDIIISPTIVPKKGSYGHAGIIAEPGGASIISNSSNAKTLQQNYTAEKWTSRFVNDRGLEVYIYRPK